MAMTICYVYDSEWHSVSSDMFEKKYTNQGKVLLDAGIWNDPDRLTARSIISNNIKHKNISYNKRIARLRVQSIFGE